MKTGTNSAANRRRALLFCSASLIMLTVATMSRAADYTWLGTDSTDWFDAENWEGGLLPAGSPADQTFISMPVAAVVAQPGAVSGTLDVGRRDTGTLIVRSGGTLSTRFAYIGSRTGSTGTVTVDGPGSTWSNSGTVLVGYVVGSTGILTVQNGGTVSSRNGFISATPGSTGTVTVDGSGSTWSNSNNVLVGDGGTGTLTIRNHGTVSAPGTIIANQPSSTGTLAIGAGLGQAAAAPGTLDSPTVIFGVGTGTAVFNHTATDYVFAPTISGTGTVTVEHGTTTLTGANTYTGGTTINGGTLIGSATSFGSGAIVNRGALVFDQVTDASFANGITGSGSVTKTGAGTLMLSGANSYDGDTIVDGGALILQSGGAISNASGDIGDEAGSTGLVTVDGAGSSWTSDYYLNIGINGTGTLTLQNGGTASALEGRVGWNNGSTGTVTVDGPGSAWTNTDALLIGYLGNGRLTVQNNGTVSAVRVIVAAQPEATGTLAIGAGLGEEAAAPGTLDSPTVTFGVGTGSIVFNHTATDYVFAPGISGAGSISVAAGTTTLTGSNTYTGGTTIAAGTLVGSASSFGSGAIVDNAALVIDQTGDAGFANGISGTGSLAKTGAGTLTLSGINSYSGGTTVDGGTLRAGGVGAFVNNTAYTVNGGTLDLNSELLTMSSLSGAGGTVVLGTADLKVDQSSNTNYGGSITGAGVLFKQGAGTLALTGTGSLVAGVAVSGGTLEFDQAGLFNTVDYVTQSGAATSIGANAQLAVIETFTQASGSTLNVAIGANDPAITADTASLAGTLNVSGYAGSQYTVIHTTGGITGDFDNVSIGGATSPVDYLTAMGKISGNDYIVDTALTWNAGPALAHGTFTLADAAEAFDVGVPLTDQAGPFTSGWDGKSLTKNGDGTLTLSAMNGYTGPTTINGGTLTVAAGGGVTSDVANNATFVNAGSVAGRVTNNAGASFIQNAGRVSNGVANAGTVNADGGALDGAIVNQAGGSFTVGGAVTGNGAFDNASGATLTVTAAGSYALAGLLNNSGTITVAAGGSLTTHGGILNSAGGGITNNGKLTDELANAGLVTNNATYNANVAANTGTLVNSIGAVWNGDVSTAGILDNGGTINGSLTQSAGTTTNNGGIAGAVTVSGGLFTGTGSVGSLTVHGGATVAPGTGGGIGTIGVANSLTFNAGSIYQVAVNAAGQSSRIDATGAIAINGGMVKVLAGSSSYAPSTTYTILNTSTNDARTGTFDGVSSNLAFLTPSLDYDASNVYLTMARNGISFAGIGDTANQRAVGVGVEALGFGNAVWNAVVQLDAPGARRAFDQLSGEVYASAKTALIEDSRFVREAAIDRLRTAFDAAGTAETRATGSASEGPGHLSAAAEPFAFWGRGFGSWGYTGSDGNAARLNRTTGGFFLGGDGLIAETWRLGLLGGYSRTSFNVRDRNASGTSDNYHLGLYGGTQWDQLAFRTGAAYTRHDISTSRSVTFPGFFDSLDGEYDAGTAQVFGELAYGLRAGNVGLEPFANLAYVDLHTDSFRETGGAAALTGNGGSTDATFATLGLRASTSFRLATVDATATGTLGWRHAFGAVVPLSVMAFAGGTTFTVAGVPVARDAAVLEAGLDLTLAPSATLGLSYSAQFASDVSDQSLRGTLTWRF